MFKKITADKAKKIMRKGQIREEKRKIKLEKQEYKQHLIAIKKVAKQGYNYLTTVHFLEPWMEEKLRELGFTVIDHGLCGYEIRW